MQMLKILKIKNKKKENHKKLINLKKPKNKKIIKKNKPKNKKLEMIYLMMMIQHLPHLLQSQL